MKITFFYPLLLFLFSFGLASGQAPCEVKEVKMTIDGTSSLHDWTSEVTEVEAAGNLSLADGKLEGIESLRVTIPVTSIKSSKGNIMDKKTYKAFDSEQHPNIVYTLKEVTSISRDGEAYTIEATGDLTMAGATKAVKMTVTGNALGDGTIRFQGSKKLDMTEWKMDPPTAMFGTLKTGKDVTINFDLMLGTTKS